MATITISNDPQKNVEQLFAMLKSVSEFDEIEVRGIITAIISPTEREQCFQLIYHRCVANVASLKILTNRQHFQAISMITRNMFELVLDIKLINVIPNAVPKMIGFIDVEKARCARKIIKFKVVHPTIQRDVSIYQSFIAHEGVRIDAMKATLWPGVKRLEHWSNKSLKDRAALLGTKYDEIYEVEQPRLSWQVHSGLAGISYQKMESYTALCGVAIASCTDSYEGILLSVIEEFKISKADDKIKGKLKAAKLAAFAKDQAEADLIYRQLTS
jgi:hypothetical protein